MSKTTVLAPISAERDRFLVDLERSGSITLAVKLSGRKEYEWRSYKDVDAEFASAWDEARESSIDVLEQEARRRAVEGVERTLYYQGQAIGTEQQHSDALLMFLLRGLKPGKYGTRTQLDIGTAKSAGSVNSPTNLTPDQRARLESLATDILQSGSLEGQTIPSDARDVTPSQPASDPSDLGG